jgi:hypothetical protein
VLQNKTTKREVIGKPLSLVEFDIGASNRFRKPLLLCRAFDSSPYRLD